MEIQAALFDWDGFLLDSEAACLTAHNVVVRECGLPELTAEQYRRRPNNTIEWYRSSGIHLPTEEIYRLFFANFDISQCGLVSGARELLTNLVDRKVHIAIVSAHPANEIEQRLSEFGIRDVFRQVYGDARNGKRDAILEVCGRLEVLPHNTLFGDDMPGGVADGKAAGVRTVLYAPSDYPNEHVADHHVSDLRHILALL